MGDFLPKKKARRRTLFETLQEAEEDHLADCPNADFVIRLSAFVLDSVIFVLLGYSVIQLFKLLALIFPILRENLSWLVSVQIGIEATLYYFYFLFSLHHFGASPGKWLLGLRVVDVDQGKTLPIYRVVLREIFGKVLGGMIVYGFILVLIRKDHRALHDLISNSVVKRIRGAE